MSRCKLEISTIYTRLGFVVCFQPAHDIACIKKGGAGSWNDDELRHEMSIFQIQYIELRWYIEVSGAAEQDWSMTNTEFSAARAYRTHAASLLRPSHPPVFPK
jgi:hypothetical protein